MPDLVEKHIKKELEAGRISGPHDSPPFSSFQCSPIGLVEKKEKGTYRMIHHLSYPEGSSVNAQIDPEWTSVQYASIWDAIDLVNKTCPMAFMAKTDVKSAFRVIPLHPEVHPLFVFHWDGKYYVDMALPMGCSSSCQIFESLSTAINWIANKKLGINMVHILDDFFLVSVSEQVGTLQLNSFLDMCSDIGLPMAPEKTFWPANTMSFVGYEIDTVQRTVRLPTEKVEKCKSEISAMLLKDKATLKEIQSIVGLLNFVYAVILPGIAFLRRLIDLTIGLKAPFHRRRLTKEVKADLNLWLSFLAEYNGVSTLPANVIFSTHEIGLFTDASGALGYGAIFGQAWFNGTWSEWWLHQNITLKELYPIVLAVEVWGYLFQNKRLVLHTDNNAIVSVITKQTSKEPLVMVLVRRMVKYCLKHNIVLSAYHIPGAENSAADAISRFQMERFRSLVPSAHRLPTPIPVLPQQL